MSKKRLCLFVFLGTIFVTSLGIVLSRNNINFSGLLNASVAVKEDNTDVIESAKRMILDNIDKYDGEVSITINDLIKNKYLSIEELEKNNTIYSDDTRVIIIVKNGRIIDTYIKNNLFRNVYSCEDLCYLNDDNYIAYNNDIYRIIKIDQNGYLYITNGDIKKLKNNNINKELRRIYNNLDKSITDNVVSLSENDINNYKIDIKRDIIINTNSGYKKYNSINEQIEDISTVENSYIIPVIILKNNLSYEMGTGSKFNPYILSK